MFAVTPGATYQASYVYFYQYANSIASTSSAGTFEMLFNGVVVQSLTRSGPNNTNQTRTFTDVVPSGTSSLQITYERLQGQLHQLQHLNRDVPAVRPTPVRDEAYA